MKVKFREGEAIGNVQVYSLKSMMLYQKRIEAVILWPTLTLCSLTTHLLLICFSFAANLLLLLKFLEAVFCQIYEMPKTKWTT